MRPILATLLLALVIAPTTASADGLPLPVEDVGPSGVASGDGRYRYVTIAAGDHTLVERIEQDGGEVSASTRLEGTFTIPAVGLDGSPGGLSHDGETLVLISPRQTFPRDRTEFVRFDADELKSPHPFTLNGDFSFDALSPDGRTMYLINYTSRRDPTEYDVRSFDLARERILPGRIVDPEEAGDEMYGFALARETSADGRWAYTLYWGREHPFIHALDTENAVAACIDLDDVHGRDMYALGLDHGDPGQLVVTTKGNPVAVVDTETHAVSEPPPVNIGAPSEARSDSGSGSGFPVAAAIALAIGLALLVGSLAMLGLRRRPRAPA